MPTYDINIYPYGNFLIPIHSLTVTYAILKHQFLDIQIAIKRSIVYSILAALISAFYLTIIFILERTIQDFVGYRSLLISVTAAFFLGIVLIPLKNKIQYIVDRYFLRGTPQQLAQQLEQLKEEVAQTERYKTLSAISSGVAHEIKNPLTALKTFAEYLPQKLEDKEFLKKFARIVGTEVDRINEMVHQLLDYSKPAPLSLKKTDIHKLLDDTLSIFNSQFVSKRIAVEKHYAARGAPAPVDQNKMRQALINIIVNAVEAMPNGGIISIKTEEGREKKEDKKLMITIRDSGAGIKPEDLPHIFDPFFSQKDNGTGLGLAITQGIIENHKGKIAVRSQLGVGTEVQIELPIQD